jgi:hypothetical protein
MRSRSDVWHRCGRRCKPALARLRPGRGRRNRGGKNDKCYGANVRLQHQTGLHRRPPKSTSKWYVGCARASACARIVSEVSVQLGSLSCHEGRQSDLFPPYSEPSWLIALISVELSKMYKSAVILRKLPHDGSSISFSNAEAVSCEHACQRRLGFGHQ